jgi:hypothetical protein
MWKKALVFISLFSFAVPAIAMERRCYNDTISKVATSGNIITTVSGHIYEIEDFDTFETQLWLPTEELLICEISDIRQSRVITIYDIINMEQGGEKIWANRLK